MFSDFDSPEDIQPTAANGRILGKFRPKARTIHKPITPPVNPPNASQPKISPAVDPLPNSTKPLVTQEATSYSDSAASVADGDADLLQKDLRSSGLKDAIVSVSSSLGPSAVETAQICNTFVLPETEEHVGPTEASLLDAASSGNDKSGEESVNMFSNMESHDFLGQPNTVTARSMGKFQPKVNSQIRGEKASPSSIMHDATDSINVSSFRPCSYVPIDSSSAHQVNQDPAIHVEASHALTEEVALRSDMETVDDILDQATSIDSHIFCPDEVLVGVQCSSSQVDQADCPLFESPPDSLSQPNTNIGRGMRKFQPKLNVRTKNVKPIAPAICDDDHLPSETESFRDHAIVLPFDSHIDSSAMWTHDSSTFLSANEYPVTRVQVDASAIPGNKAVSPESNKDFQSTHEDLEKDSTSGRKRKPSARAKGNKGTIQPQNDEPSQDVFDERSIPENDEENISGKSLMQLRKRKAACSPIDVQDNRTNENSELEHSNNSQIGDDYIDDEYNGQDMPWKKQVTRKPKRSSSENEKLVRSRKKASEGPDPVTQETSKKKFTHSTRRNRRRVDKILLGTPEEDIDRANLRIKDLIMLAEFNERKSVREEAALKPSFPIQSFSPNESNLDDENPFSQDRDTVIGNDEASHQVQPISTKLNYHTYMTRTRVERWSKSDTELFYQAVRQFGTDFAMIQQLFPNRTRHQVKLKFKNEERKHPLQIADVLVHRSQDHSHFELVIQQLQAQAEQNSNRDITGDPMAESPRGTGENEEEESRRVDKKEEPEVNDWECGHSPSKSDEIQDVFDWNQYDTANASLPRDTKKDEYERF